MIKKIIAIALAVSTIYPQVNLDKFKQLNEDITTPNTYRTAAGYPGHDYWQQEADYDMDLVIDDENQRLYGEETITFHNNSPDQLSYLWVQLDQNVRALDSDSYKIQSSGDFGAQRGREKMTVGESIPLSTLENFYRDFDGGFKIEHVKDGLNRDLPYIINKTMMRIDLPTPLRAGQSYKFKIKWWYILMTILEMAEDLDMNILKKMIIISIPSHNSSHACVCIMTYTAGKINSF